MSNGFADSNRASLRYIAEDTNAWGVTPASGVVREMRLTGSEIKASKDTVQSNELRADRMIPSIIETGAKTDGSIKIEFSNGAMDDFLAAFVYGAWTRPMGQDKAAGVGVSFGTSSKIYVSGDQTAYFTAGRRVKTEGFLTAANNDYFQISAVAFVSGSNRTEITLTTSTGVVEAGSVLTKVIDANDVIVLKNTTIRFGTGGNASIDSNGGNAFAAAKAAHQIKVGQKLFIESHLAYEVGSVAISAAPAAGTKLTINDGAKDLVFQFGGTAPASTVIVAPGADEVEAGDNLVAAIAKAYRDGKIQAKGANAAGTVTITNLNRLGGGSLVEADDTGLALVVTDFAGGDPTLGGVVTVTSVSDDEIGITPAPSTNANAGNAQVTIKGSMLRNPSDFNDFVKQSFSIETSFEDIGQHFVARGLRVGTFDLSVSAGEIVNGSIEFMGSESKRYTASQLRGGAYTNKKATEHEVMNATNDVGSLTLNGEKLSTALKEISLKGNAALREQRAVGSKFARGIGVGRFDLTGSIKAYFETGEMFDRFINHETVSLGFDFKDVDGNYFAVTLPAIKLTSDPVSPGKIDEDVMEDLEWKAQRDPATECMIQFDRFSSVKAPTA